MKRYLARFKNNLPARKKEELDFDICPNCGNLETGNYCPNCGQSNKDFNKPLKEVFSDLMDSINLDVRMARTLIPFFFRPGYLTEEYFKGRRRRYVPPMRMYIIASIVFFFFLQKNTIDLSHELDDNLNKEGGINAIDSIPGIRFDFSEFGINDTLNQSPMELIDELKKDSSISKNGKAMIDNTSKPNGVKDLFISKFYNYSSYAVFLLMPVFAFLLMVMYLKTKTYYVNHLIFSINMHTFMFAVFTLIFVFYIYVLPDNLKENTFYLFFAIPLYLYIGMKKYYKRSYIGTFFRLALLCFLYLIIVSTSIITTIVITANELDVL